MATVNLKINRIDIKLKIFILPIVWGILFGSIITYISLKKTRHLEERINKKTKELEHYAAMDDMTNTYNRRMGMKMLENHFILSKRHRNILSLCFVDIDGLKYVNDSFGHAEGDKLIRDVSEMMRLSIRESDILFRMGGDEFVIIFPECNLNGARKVMRRLAEKMKAYNELSPKGYSASVSFGILESSRYDERTIEELLAEADNKMYAMKKSIKSSFYEKPYCS